MALVVLLFKRRDLVFNWMFLLFAAFIFACGTTHLIKIWTIWHASYWLEASVDAFTGVLSALTALLLWPMIPKILALPSHSQMEAANQALKEQIAQREKAEQKFRGFLESAPDAMVIIDDKGKIVLVNSLTETIFGYNRTELLDQSVMLLIPEGLNPNGNGQEYFSSMQSVSSDGSRELFARRKDKSEFPVEIKLSPLQTEEGMLVSSVIRDISHRRENAEKQKLLSEKISESNHELQQFAYIVSHDLQEPLRSISTFGDLLAGSCRAKLSDQEKEFLGIVIDANGRMQQLITDLLAYSRIERTAMEAVPVDTAIIVKQALMNLHAAIEESEAKITVEDLPKIEADPGQMSQLFQNLIGNAIKYKGSKRPEIVVSSTRQGDQWLFSIKDNGIGFDMKFAERIFEPFQRLHAGGKYPGTGIGLAICKKIVERLNGKIWVESQYGDDAGSTFFFTVPVQVQEEHR